MTRPHDYRVQQQFAVQAASFDDQGFAVRGLDWIVETIDPLGHELALDVACGAGHLARALAPKVAAVCGVDLTVEMLRQAHALVSATTRQNLTFQLGDAMHLPWIDDQFDLTVCRLALHQVADPAAVVAEMVRVTRPGGRVTIADMIVDDDPPIAAETNRLERLRDPSHGTALTTSTITNSVTTAGGRVVRTDIRDQPLDLEDWLSRTNTSGRDSAHIRHRLHEELDGGIPTGLFPKIADDGRISTIVHRWLVVVAEVRP